MFWSPTTHGNYSMINKQICTGMGALIALLISTFAWSDPPAQSGIVTRTTAPDALVVFFYDPGNDLTHFIGVDIVGFCSGELTPGEAIADLSLLEVLINGQDRERLVYMDQGEGYAGVWQGDVISGDLCGNVLGSPPVAQGSVTWRYTDNDIDWFSSCEADGTSPSHANSWGFVARGVLEDYFGQPTPYSGGEHSVWQSCDPSTFKVTARIHLQGYTN